MLKRCAGLLITLIDNFSLVLRLLGLKHDLDVEYFQNLSVWSAPDWSILHQRFYHMISFEDPLNLLIITKFMCKAYSKNFLSLNSHLIMAYALIRPVWLLKNCFKISFETNTLLIIRHWLLTLTRNVYQCLFCLLNYFHFCFCYFLPFLIPFQEGINQKSEQIFVFVTDMFCFLIPRRCFVFICLTLHLWFSLISIDW